MSYKDFSHSKSIQPLFFLFDLYATYKMYIQQNQTYVVL